MNPTGTSRPFHESQPARQNPEGCVEVLGGNEARTQALLLAGLEIVLVARPAGGQAGGDLYCLHSCDNRSSAKIVLVDVTGHGSRTASIARGLHDLLHKYSPDTQPSHLLDLLNREFPQFAPPGILATALCAVYDSGRGELRYANGGQPPLLLWSARQRRWKSVGRSWDSACGVPFGVTEGACYDEEPVPLEPGDVVLLVSDGLPEAHSPTGGLLQPEGLLRLAQESMEAFPASYPVPLAAVADAFLKKLRAFQGQADFRDDVTLLWIRRPAASEPSHPSGHDL